MKVQITVSLVIARGLVILSVSQPPRTPVTGPPPTLLRDVAVHSEIATASAFVIFVKGDIDDHIIFPWIVAIISAQGIVHDCPVCFGWWGPYFPPRGTRVCLCAESHPVPIDDLNESTR